MTTSTCCHRLDTCRSPYHNRIRRSSMTFTLLPTLFSVVCLFIVSKSHVFSMLDRQAPQSPSRPMMMPTRHRRRTRNKERTITTTIQWKDPVASLSSEEFYDQTFWSSTRTKNNSEKRSILWFGPMPSIHDALDQLQNQQQQQDIMNRNGKETLHPLRTNKWEFNIHWFHRNQRNSFFNFVTRNNPPKSTVIVELDYPSGYCRVLSKGNDNQNKDDSSHTEKNIPIGIGRWMKRPWGVTIRIHPLEVWGEPSMTRQKYNEMSSSSSFPDVNNYNNQQLLFKLHAQREYILFASAFHWNSFAEQPKLTKGTILQQKPNSLPRKKTFLSSSPSSSWWLWYENEDDHEYFDNDMNAVNVLYRPDLPSTSYISNVRRKICGLSQPSERNGVARTVARWIRNNNVSIPNYNQWFRPVVGSFHGKGIGDDGSMTVCQR